MLLVEDNQLNAEIAAKVLKMSGLTVDCAWDGIEAVDCLSSCPDGYYDMVFMDIQMPRMNGYDATRAIRSSARDYCKRVPIVAMTANAFAEDVQAAKTVGMNEHIAKPLELTSMWAIRKGTAALAEGGRDALSRIQSAFHTSVSHTHGCICFRGFASADATRGAFQLSP